MQQNISCILTLCNYLVALITKTATIFVVVYPSFSVNATMVDVNHCCTEGRESCTEDRESFSEYS